MTWTSWCQKGKGRLAETFRSGVYSSKWFSVCAFLKKVSQTHSKNKISALQGLRLGLVQVFTHPSSGLYIASSIVFSKIMRSPDTALPFWTVHLLASDFVLNVIFCFVIRLKGANVMTRASLRDCALTAQQAFVQWMRRISIAGHAGFIFFHFLPTSLKMISCCLFTVNAWLFLLLGGGGWIPVTFYTKRPLLKKTDKSQNIHFSETNLWTAVAITITNIHPETENTGMDIVTVDDNLHGNHNKSVCQYEISGVMTPAISE